MEQKSYNRSFKIGKSILLILCVIVLVGVSGTILAVSRKTVVDEPDRITETDLVTATAISSPSTTQSLIVLKQLSFSPWSQDNIPDMSFKLMMPTEARLIEDTNDRKVINHEQAKITIYMVHAAVPVSYARVDQISQGSLGKSVYRVILESGNIQYSNDLNKDECPDAPADVTAPCGYPTYNGLEIICDSSEAIRFCDDIVRSIDDVEFKRY